MVDGLSEKHQYLLNLKLNFHYLKDSFIIFLWKELLDWKS